MKKEDIEVGGTYAATLGGRKVDVRIERVNPRGGWDATSLATNKKVRIQNVRQIRHSVPVGAEALGEPAPKEEPEAPVTAPRAVKEVKGSKSPRKPRVAKEPQGESESAPKAMTCLEAALAVLRANGGAMRCTDLVKAMAEQNLWTTGAPTPAATLYSAILREMTRKPDTSRFRKADRGQFALTTAGA